MVNGQWSMVNGQWSMVNGQWSMVNGQWSIVKRQKAGGRSKIKLQTTLRERQRRTDFILLSLTFANFWE
jgi:hypothetical protein